jgi:hypothetical protein
VPKTAAGQRSERGGGDCHCQPLPPLPLPRQGFPDYSSRGRTLEQMRESAERMRASRTLEQMQAGALRMNASLAQRAAAGARTAPQLCRTVLSLPTDNT